MEELELAIFDIINNGGTAKGLSYEALDAAMENDFEKANELLSEAEEFLLLAHKTQTKMITNEINGEPVKMSLLMVHAQDHLMTAIEANSLIKKMIELIKKVG